MRALAALVEALGARKRRDNGRITDDHVGTRGGQRALRALRERPLTCISDDPHRSHPAILLCRLPPGAEGATPFVRAATGRAAQLGRRLHIPFIASAVFAFREQGISMRKESNEAMV